MVPVLRLRGRSIRSLCMDRTRTQCFRDLKELPKPKRYALLNLKILGPNPALLPNVSVTVTAIFDMTGSHAELLSIKLFAIILCSGVL